MNQIAKKNYGVKFCGLMLGLGFMGTAFAATIDPTIFNEEFYGIYTGLNCTLKIAPVAVAAGADPRVSFEVTNYQRNGTVLHAIYEEDLSVVAEHQALAYTEKSGFAQSAYAIKYNLITDPSLAYSLQNRGFNNENPQAFSLSVWKRDLEVSGRKIHKGDVNYVNIYPLEEIPLKNGDFETVQKQVATPGCMHMGGSRKLSL